MTPRLLLLLAVVAFSGCQWDSRPDGGSPTHTDDPAYSLDPREAGTTAEIEATEAEVVEPLDAAPGASTNPTPQALPTPAPIDTTQ